MTTTTLAIGDRLGKVVISFPGPTTECELDAETAREVGEQLAKSAYTAHYGRPPPRGGSHIAKEKVDHLKARATLIIRSLTDRGANAGYIAEHVVRMLVSEM